MRPGFLLESACHLLLAISVSCSVCSHNLTIFRQSPPTAKTIVWINQWERRNQVRAHVSRASGSSPTQPMSRRQIHHSPPTPLQPALSGNQCDSLFPFVFIPVSTFQHYIWFCTFYLLINLEMNVRAHHPHTFWSSWKEWIVILQAKRQHFKIELKPAPL